MPQSWVRAADNKKLENTVTVVAATVPTLTDCVTNTILSFAILSFVSCWGRIATIFESRAIGSELLLVIK
jgi:hypothetical protein